MKNGITFTSIISQEKFENGIWDPFHYRNSNTSEVLNKYVTISKIAQRGNVNHLKYAPIEYKDIPRGNIIGFNLLKQSSSPNKTLPIVPNETLLFGTMRAYLGNVLVTPKSEWLSSSKSWFAVNSEFVQIIPKDDLIYFWWAFFKSPSFLCTLPTGTGGTRPRTSVDQLLNTAIIVPNIEKRNEIDTELKSIAKNYWEQALKLENTLSKLVFFYNE